MRDMLLAQDGVLTRTLELLADQFLVLLEDVLTHVGAFVLLLAVQVLHLAAQVEAAVGFFQHP